ncbi:gallate 1-beta-glucosyltransferase-like [Lotus japonicus]|uniref:gallate 1-beta-glucosyltransferase-like n=1 Tax=Lotus japonicus TaxID=34305 RepID=UPI002587F8A7|nr:gallate 1-beta-glucosyltransferase-like [Lotus japonicus]
MVSESPIHVLLVSFPAQGHISPLLRLGKHLAAKGLFVTFSTTRQKGEEMVVAAAATTTTTTATANGTSSPPPPTPIGDGFLQFDLYDDGLPEDHPTRNDLKDYSLQIAEYGKKILPQLIKKHADANRPVSCIINNPFVSWVCEVAAELDIPCAMYWIHACATFVACHHYFQKLTPFPTETEPYLDVQLPTLHLKYNEVPGFLHPFSPVPFVQTLVTQQFDQLSKIFCIIMDTFEELEQDSFNYLSSDLNILIRPVGPLYKMPLGAAAAENSNSTSKKADDSIIEWLNSKQKSSVVYICFGTILPLPIEQLGEIAYALLESEVSFLWVLRESHKEEALKTGAFPDGFFEKISERGKVVKWCPQEKVLAHSSVACYFTHCGWNSTLETVSSGVPMLTFSQISDQMTNAKLIVDVFKVGIRVSHHGLSEKKLVKSDEIKRCLVEAMVGPKAEELKRNALKWKDAAAAARARGGSSDRNLDAFVEDIKKVAVKKFVGN